MAINPLMLGAGFFLFVGVVIAILFATGVLGKKKDDGSDDDDDDDSGDDSGSNDDSDSDCPEGQNLVDGVCKSSAPVASPAPPRIDIHSLDGSGETFTESQVRDLYTKGTPDGNYTKYDNKSLSSVNRGLIPNVGQNYQAITGEPFGSWTEDNCKAKCANLTSCTGLVWNPSASPEYQKCRLQRVSAPSDVVLTNNANIKDDQGKTLYIKSKYVSN